MLYFKNTIWFFKYCSNFNLSLISICLLSSALNQESANFFHKVSKNKYFLLCEPNGLWCNYSNKLLFYESSHNLHVDELAWLCSNKILFINKWVYPVDLTHDLQSENPWFKSSSYLTHVLLFSFPSLTQNTFSQSG